MYLPTLAPEHRRIRHRVATCRAVTQQAHSLLPMRAESYRVEHLRTRSRVANLRTPPVGTARSAPGLAYERPFRRWSVRPSRRATPPDMIPPARVHPPPWPAPHWSLLCRQARSTLQQLPPICPDSLPFGALATQPRQWGCTTQS